MVIVAEEPIHVFKLENVYEINPNSHYIIVSMTLLIYLLHFFITTNVEQRKRQRNGYTLCCKCSYLHLCYFFFFFFFFEGLYFLRKH